MNDAKITPNSGSAGGSRSQVMSGNACRLAAENLIAAMKREDGTYRTYCMAYRDRFAREGRESMHLLELVYGTSADHCPDISTKRYNRLGLKNQLLQEIWKEDAEDMDLGFTITYTPKAEKRMDDRMIPKTDVIRVLQALRKTGLAVLDGETGLCFTRSRLGNVTFWVKYGSIINVGVRR